MSSNNAGEEILLYSHEDASSPLDESAKANVTEQITQTKQWKHLRKVLHLYDNQTIGISDYSSGGNKQFWLNLNHIDLQPNRQSNRFWKGYLATLLLLIVGALMFAHNTVGVLENLTIPYQASIAVIIISSGLIVLLFTLHRSSNELVYYSSHGQVPLFSMFYNTPNKREFRVFVNKLSGAIKTAKAQEFYNKAEQLAVELSEHRRLKNEGILSAQQYDQAKINIMKCH